MSKPIGNKCGISIWDIPHNTPLKCDLRNGFRQRTKGLFGSHVFSPICIKLIFFLLLLQESQKTSEVFNIHIQKHYTKKLFFLHSFPFSYTKNTHKNTYISNILLQLELGRGATNTICLNQDIYLLLLGPKK